MLRMNWYPRSFPRLILIGYGLALLPLLIAIGYVLFSLNALSAQFQTALERTATAERLKWELSDNLEHMDSVLKRADPADLKTRLAQYREERTHWRRSSAEFQHLVSDDASLVAATTRLLAREEAALQQAERERTTAPLLAALPELQGGLPAVFASSQKMVEQTRNGFAESESAVRRRLLYALLSATISTLLIIALAQRMIGRLLAAFERAVRRLGVGELERPIRLGGTRDMHWLGRRLDWLRQRLLQLERERTRLLRHASHELKTPLAALREGAALLGEGGLGPINAEQADVVAIMRNNALRLERLIEALLQLQRAGYASAHMKLETLQLEAALEQVLATHRLSARDKQLAIEVQAETLAVEAGQEELLTILNNLIANAIKYSPPGGKIVIRLVRHGDFALLDVQDEGPGVADAEAETIFEPFFRSASTKGIGGFGLGLPIAREYARALGGELWLATAPPRGALFRLRLPLREG